MLAHRVELWEWGAWKVWVSTFRALHYQSSAQRDNIKPFFYRFFFFFTSATDFIEKQELLEVWRKVALVNTCDVS